MHVGAELCGCTAETNTTLSRNFPPIKEQFFFFNRKKNSQRDVGSVDYLVTGQWQFVSMTTEKEKREYLLWLKGFWIPLERPVKCERCSDGERRSPL